IHNFIRRIWRICSSLYFKSVCVMNLTKNTVHNMWSGGANTNMWADWLSFNPNDEFAVVAVVDGKEYVVYKDKVQNIMN
ncbi:hypothetical protein ACT4UL_28585, partial [Bacillus sp. HC-TM]